jgi:isochorismate synthase
MITPLTTYNTEQHGIYLMCKPNDDVINVYVFDKTPIESTSLNEQGCICICPFINDIPILYPIVDHQSIAIDQFDQIIDSLTIELKANEVTTDTTKEHYIEHVVKALHAFRTGFMDKVVLAQRQYVEVTNPEPLQQFKSLLANDDAYRYLFHITGKETWMGASPELFLKCENNRLETMALAGTRKPSSLDQWGEKEIKEQAIVGDFITHQLEKLGFADVTLGNTFTKRQGNLEHICSPVYARCPESIDWISVFHAMHPTPALAGYPKNEAMWFIQHTEDFDRELFGGYMGITHGNHIDLFVNIRCAKLGQKAYQLYAGAGLNNQSDPEKEWEETNSKLEIIKSTLT